MATITHTFVDPSTDWTQADVDAEIAAGRLAAGTLAADMVKPSHWNDTHQVSDIVNADISATAGILLSKTNISLTTTGSSGAATLNTTTGVLNIPQYSGGGGSSAFNDITSGTNTIAAMVVGTGASLAASGSGTIVSTSCTGNAATATIFQTARNINGVSFNGSADITVTAAAGTLTGTTLASGVTASSLTSVGTITTGVWNGTDIAVADGGTGSSTAAGARTNLGLSARAIIFGAVTPGNDTVYLTTYAPFAFTINSVQNIQTSSGTITAAVKINGTNVTGLSAIAVTSSSQDVNATAANTVAVGDEVTVVLSSNSSAANLRGTILITV